MFPRYLNYDLPSIFNFQKVQKVSIACEFHCNTCVCVHFSFTKSYQMLAAKIHMTAKYVQ